MPYDPKSYEERQAANDRSKLCAYRDHEPWTDDDLEFLLEFWVCAVIRDEPEVARALGRTIAACQVRASIEFGERTGRRYIKEVTTTTREIHWVDDDEWPASLGYVKG